MAFEYFNRESSYVNSDNNISLETEEKIKAFRSRQRKLGLTALKNV